MVKQRIRTQMDTQGRVLIPASIRKQLGLKPGEMLTLTLEDGSLRLRSVLASVHHAQAIAERYVNGRTGLVDEFIAERRREAAKE